jgi:DNA repair protein RecN (Recombination protein N)
MLRHIQIRDLAIVEALTLELEPGMTALTGETGAGKSILIDALGLALGTTADRNLVRAGRERAEVTALFELPPEAPALHWLEEQALASDRECILRRVVAREGRSRAFINGRPVTRALLAELGEQLVEIHGQHEHLRLLHPAVLRLVLEAWAGHLALLQPVALKHARWRRAREALERLQAESGERARRLDYLTFQIGELRQLAPLAEELKALEGEQRRLANADELGSELAGLLETLTDGEPSAQGLLTRCTLASERLAGALAPELAPAAQLLESARIQAEEAADLLRSFAAGIEHDPDRLAEVDRRLGELHDAARKHRVEAAQLPALLAELEAEQARLEQAGENLETLETEQKAARQAWLEACEALTKSRRKAATKLAKVITASLQELAMAGGRFEITVEALAEERGAAHGLDNITFLVSANPGQPLAPLSRVASGGELSRLSLAIQVATTSLGSVPTLIFDEVDVGIGGAVAETVGRLLRELGGARQVLCVTHLPQVAARAHHHLKVEKKTGRKSTRTGIQPLSEKERVREIARMVGGSRITPQTLAHAEEMMISGK